MFKFINSDKSKAELNVTANTSTLELSDNSKLEALINSTDIKVDLYQRADAKIEGDVDTLITIDATGSSEVYLYENPKITINKFEGTVKLHKKEL